MVCWLIIRNDDTGAMRDSHPFKSAKEAQRYAVGLEERYDVPIRTELVWLLPGEIPR